MRKLLLLAFLLPVLCKAQIKLSAGFSCTKSKENYRDNYFSDGTMRIGTDFYNREFDNSEQMMSSFAQTEKLKYSKTNDHLYWATGKIGDRYFYIVVVPEFLEKIFVSSTDNDTDFKEQSVWILKTIRQYRNVLKGISFVDAQGNDCSL